MSLSFATLLLALAFGVTDAQFLRPDERTRNLTVINLPGNVNVSYKEPHGVCKTAASSQQQYTGWVSVPGDYAANLFFYYVEAREPTDNLTVWLTGGPGGSSLYAFFGYNGPCEIVERGLNSYETVAREWGWDGASNMLFIDQPNHTGFSYDTPTDGTLSMVEETLVMPPTYDPNAVTSWDSVNGTFSSGNPMHTANTTQSAALAVWHVMQGFLTATPHRHLNRTSSLAVSLFTESYGGIYGPIFSEVWQKQNEKWRAGALDPSAVEIRLTSLGILNGCVDVATDVANFVHFGVNNTYGIKFFSAQEADELLRNFTAPGGDKDLIAHCAALAAQLDAEGAGHQPEVIDACSKATEMYNKTKMIPVQSGKSPYDILAPERHPPGPLRLLDYLNQAEILNAIGSPVNFTMLSDPVFQNFKKTRDQFRGGNIGRLASLLNRGVRVALVYGDRDYCCNWFSGEDVSLQVAQKAGGQYAAKFPAAGYAPIVTNPTYDGGQVRQFGNLSFSRVFQATHSAGVEQPETMFRIFSRVLSGNSISTGDVVDLRSFSTTGSPESTRKHDDAPELPKQPCYVRGFAMSCDDDAWALAKRGGGVVINGILYNKTEDWPLAT
ncbi:hypothetical protein RJ55_02505 [Drechmeria coniospora]|nr:hypothetical protein RJ55_02505 [Drechmeria coniospora]